MAARLRSNAAIRRRHQRALASVRPGTASAHSGRGHSIDLRALQPRGIIFACSDPTPHRYNGACFHRSAASKFTRRIQSNTYSRGLERYIALVYDVLNAIELTNSQFTKLLNSGFKITSTINLSTNYLLEVLNKT
jgi:hypothetical protein